MSIFWPDITDKNEAHRACGQGAGVAFFVAVVTGIVAWMQMQGKASFLPNIGGGALLDAGLFFAIGLGICFHSRLAAVAGLLLYLAERIFMIKMNGPNAGGIFSGIIFTLGFVASVRGTFAWHEYRRQEKEEERSAVPAQSILPRLGEAQGNMEESRQADDSDSGQGRRGKLIKIALICFGVAGLVFAAGFVSHFITKGRSSQAKETAAVSGGTIPQQAQVTSVISAPQNSAAANTPSTGAGASSRTFKLKNGSVVSGRVIQDDEVYYTVETSGKRQEIVIKEDIASES